LKNQQITVRVPATTSNLGPGFDCLGVGLQLYNFVTVAQSDTTSGDWMVRQAARKFFKTVERAPFHFSCRIEGEVPPSRGLGSSVTVRLGVLHGLNAMLDYPLKRAQLFGLCAELEGHPDNAAPAEFGGFVVAGHNRHQKFPVDPRLRFVLLIPGFAVETKEARKVLPNEINPWQAVESCGNASDITPRWRAGTRRFRGRCGSSHQPSEQSSLHFSSA
jgi:homoserine kinase